MEVKQDWKASNGKEQWTVFTNGLPIMEKQNQSKDQKQLSEGTK